MDLGFGGFDPVNVFLSFLEEGVFSNHLRHQGIDVSCSELGSEVQRRLHKKF